MLVTPQPRHRRSRSSSRWRLSVAFGLALLALCLLSLAPHLGGATELVRLRNALLLDSVNEHGFDWTPDASPADFMQERGAADPVFVAAVQQLGVPAMHSDWERVRAISQHLLEHPQLVGTPIQSNLQDTYHRILREGTGYCGDFTRVFMAFALAAGIPVRSWSFSFDGFGGHGHVLPEIWNRQTGQWQLLDIFNNYYFTGADGIALSALAFRRALAEPPGSLQLRALAPATRPGYSDEAKAWDYYRRGLPEWYLSWGNNVFSYDRALLVRTLGPVSRTLEQLGAVAQGAYPPIHILGDAGNQRQVAALLRLRYHLLAVAVIAGVALLLIVVGLWVGRRARQGDARGAP